MCLNAANHLVRGLGFVGKRLGSGDGERKTLLTRQIAFEPLPASVLFGVFINAGSSWLVLALSGLKSSYHLNYADQSKQPAEHTHNNENCVIG